jgi:hypothetical protein
MQQTIHIEMDKFDEKIGGKLRRAAEKAAVRAANRTIITTRAELQREISEKLQIKRKDLIGRFHVDKASKDQPVARLIVFGRGIPLFRFAARKITVQTSKGKRTGATAMINGQRQVVPGGFIAQMASGKVGVFARRGDRRLPIEELTTNNVLDLLNRDQSLLGRIKAGAQATMKKNFERDFNYFSKGASADL